MNELSAQNDEDGATGDKELRDWLAEHIATYPHRTTAILSRAEHIGVSRKALDDYLAGKYFMPKECGGQGISPVDSKIERAIRA
jgi:hypothetical protein